jgi:hypothetical protein
MDALTISQLARPTKHVRKTHLSLARARVSMYDPRLLFFDEPSYQTHPSILGSEPLYFEAFRYLAGSPEKDQISSEVVGPGLTKFGALEAHTDYRRFHPHLSYTAQPARSNRNRGRNSNPASSQPF